MSDPISFVLPKKAIEDAMQLLDSVPARNGITSSEYIKTELKDPKHLRMQLSSEMSGDAVIPMPSPQKLKTPLYLDRRMLIPFVSAGKDLKSDTYEFIIDKNLVTVKHGTRTALLNSNNNASGYEKMPDFKTGLSIELLEDWTSITNCATLCACTDPIAPHLNCVHISPGKEKVYIRASDTMLVFQGAIPKGSFPCEESIALPLDIVDRINLFSTGICHYSPKWAMLQFSIGHLWQAVKTECRKNFPVKSIAEVVKNITAKGSVVSVLGTQSLVESAERISGYMQAASKDNPALTLKILTGKKKAHLTSGIDGASFNEAIYLENKAEGEYSIEWPMAAVLPVMKYCKNAGSAKVIQDSNGSICLKAGRVTLVTGKKKSKKKGKK